MIAISSIEKTAITRFIEVLPNDSGDQLLRNRAERDRLPQAARRVSAAALINMARAMRAGWKGRRHGSMARDARSSSLHRFGRLGIIWALFSEYKVIPIGIEHGKV